MFAILDSSINCILFLMFNVVLFIDIKQYFTGNLIEVFIDCSFQNKKVWKLYQTRLSILNISLCIHYKTKTKNFADFTKNFVDFQNFMEIEFCWRLIFFLF